MKTTTVQFANARQARLLTDALEVLSVPGVERPDNGARVIVQVPEGVSNQEHMDALEDLALTLSRGDFRIYGTWA